MISSSEYLFRFIVWSSPQDQTPRRFGSIQGGHVSVIPSRPKYGSNDARILYRKIFSFE
jgi:hypothetical protein